MPGKIVVSIDFELRWGVHDIYGLDIDGYRANLENCRFAVNQTLEMFKTRNIRATWATVGAIGLDNWNDYFNTVKSQPKYKRKKFFISEKYADIDPKGELHFAPDLVRKIIETSGQELASHTFSHVYCREEGFMLSDFVNDSECFSKIFNSKFHIIPKSIVFPRNQTKFIEHLKNINIEIYRGKKEYLFESKIGEKFQNILEVLLPMKIPSSKVSGSLTRGDLFVRFDLPIHLWKLQLRKLKYCLEHLGKDGICHIWWHPHNVGPNLTLGLARFEELFDLIAEEIYSNRIVSANMLDLVDTNFRLE